MAKANGGKKSGFGFGMELFTNLDISGRAERLERNHQRLQTLFEKPENKGGDLLAKQLYLQQMPFTLEQFELALNQLADKKVNKLGWRDTKLVRQWLQINLTHLQREREREREENWQIKFKR